MHKFKKGDTVRVKKVWSWAKQYGCKAGDLGVVEEYSTTPYCSNPRWTQRVAFDEDYLEPVYHCSELEHLVHIANQGSDAIRQLASKHPDKVEFCIGGINSWVTLISTCSPASGYRVKTTFEPFCVGRDLLPGKWVVNLVGDTLHIGCKTFDARQACGWLADLVRNSISSVGIVDQDICAVRNGIRLDGQYEISWADAERILHELEKAGVK